MISKKCPKYIIVEISESDCNFYCMSRGNLNDYKSNKDFHGL